MNKDQLLDALEDQRERLLETIDGLSDEQMLLPGVTGEWSVKDILYHISMWEADLVRLLWQVSRAETPSTAFFSGRSVHETNALWYAQGSQRPLEQVLNDFAAVRKQTLRRVEELPDDVLEDSQRFAWAEGQPLWAWIKDDTFAHDAEHAGQIKRWREAQGF